MRRRAWNSASPIEAPATPGLRVGELPPEAVGRPAWLIEELWVDQAVGLIGGPPKSCKSYLALEMAVAVASGAVASADLRSTMYLANGTFPWHDTFCI
jgi:hypothetical protein